MARVNLFFEMSILKSSKKEAKEQKDEQIESITLWTKRILTAVGVLALVAIVFSFFNKKSSEDSMKSFSAYHAVQSLEGKLFDDSGEVVRGGLIDKVVALDETKRNEYVQSLDQVISEYPGSVPAALSMLKKSALQIKLGENATALSLLQEVSKMNLGASEKSLQSIAYKLGGVALENMEKWSEAASWYDAALQNSSVTFQALFLLAQTRVYLKLKDDQGMEKALNALKEKFPGSDYEKKAQALSALGKNI